MRKSRDDSGPFPVWELAAGDEEDSRRLERTRAVIDTLRHPGLVAPAFPGGDGHGRLRTRWVGPDLAHLGRRLEAPEVAGLGAAVATTLADVHSLGWVHGGVSAEHILLDPEGRPVLCGLGAARRAGDRAEAAADASALVSVLLPLTPRAGPGARDLRRTLERCGRARRGRPPSAAFLARQLAAPHLAARLPVPAPGAPEAPAPGAGCEPASPAASRQAPDGRGTPQRRVGSTRPARRGWAVAALAAAGMAAGVGLVAAHAAGRRVACPAADRGCGPVQRPSSGVVVAGSYRFSISPAGAVMVVGRWDCGPVALPALLETGSGRVWVFDAWAAPGRPRPARLVAAVAGARSLAVVPGSDGCDRLRVLRSYGSAEVLSPKPERGKR